VFLPVELNKKFQFFFLDPKEKEPFEFGKELFQSVPGELINLVNALLSPFELVLNVYVEGNDLGNSMYLTLPKFFPVVIVPYPPPELKDKKLFETSLVVI
jgi:hypothetical protein